jgi:hypothetical protein
MKQRGEDVQRIEEALAEAHRRVAPPEPGAFFRQKVMTRVLEEAGPSRSPASNGLHTGRLAWRCALLGYLVVVLLVAQLMTSDMDSQVLLTRFFLEDSSGMDLINTFGIL